MFDNPAIVIATISGIVSLCGIAFTLYQYLTSGKPKVDADTDVSQANAAGQITDTSLELVTAIREEMRVYKERAATEMTAMRTELAAVREENRQMRISLTELEDVKDWAERLVHQVKSYGGEPVKIRVRTIQPPSAL